MNSWACITPESSACETHTNSIHTITYSITHCSRYKHTLCLTVTGPSIIFFMQNINDTLDPNLALMYTFTSKRKPFVKKREIFWRGQDHQLFLSYWQNLIPMNINPKRYLRNNSKSFLIHRMIVMVKKIHAVLFHDYWHTHYSQTSNGEHMWLWLCSICNLWCILDLCQKSMGEWADGLVFIWSYTVLSSSPSVYPREMWRANKYETVFYTDPEKGILRQDSGGRACKATSIVLFSLKYCPPGGLHI